MMTYLRVAWNDGYAKCQDGGRCCDNPFLIGDIRWLAWCKGFQQAEAEMGHKVAA